MVAKGGNESACDDVWSKRRGNRVQKAEGVGQSEDRGGGAGAVDAEGAAFAGVPGLLRLYAEERYT